jgi:hypothetical protein
MLGCANNDRSVSGELQGRGIAEQPAAGHALDEIVEPQPYRIEKLLHDVAPREKGDDKGGFTAGHLRQGLRARNWPSGACRII